MSDNNENGGGDDGSGDERIVMTKADYNAQLAAARRAGEGRASRREEPAAAKDAPRYTLSEFAELAKIFGGSAAAPTAPKPASSSTNPARVNPITAGGLIDIWNLQDHEIAQLGPSGMREQFERLIAAGEQASGRPVKPTIPNGQKR